jgi:hypothetical protein
MRQSIRHGPAAAHYSTAAAIASGRWGLPQNLAGVAVFVRLSHLDFTHRAGVPVDAGFSAMG